VTRIGVDVATELTEPDEIPGVEDSEPENVLARVGAFVGAVVKPVVAVVVGIKEIGTLGINPNAGSVGLVVTVVLVAWDDDPAGENVSCDAAGDAEVVETTAGAGGVTVLTGASVVIGVKDTGLEKILPEVGAVVIVGTTMPPGVTVDTGTALGASNNPGSVGCGFIGAVVL
jgi:hypothetical protein